MNKLSYIILFLLYLISINYALRYTTKINISTKQNRMSRYTNANNDFINEEKSIDPNSITPIEFSEPTSTNNNNIMYNTKNDIIFSDNNDNIQTNKTVLLDIKRFIIFNALALILALGANFLGITSTLMSFTNPEYFRTLKLDELYAINDMRRYNDMEDKYEFIFPTRWNQDRNILLANIREKERPQSIQLKKNIGLVRPDVAYGAINNNDKENVSVIKSQVMPGFTLKSILGEPKDAAVYLLSTVIAPENSGKVYTLINAYEDIRDKRPYYIFEYTIRNDEKQIYQHTLSAITNHGTELYTLTTTIPEDKYNSEWKKIKDIVNSFKVSGDSSYISAGFY